LKRTTVRKYLIIQLFLLIVIGLVLPISAMGAGDDCPDPGTGGFDPGTPDDTTDDTTGGDGTSGVPPVEEGGYSSSQLTIGILVAVGIIVGVVYLLMVGRYEEED
jgi:hypothetical protein